MRIFERKTNEGLVEHAERLFTLYSDVLRPKDMKPKGQFFTPKRVSIFMAELFEERVYSRVRLAILQFKKLLSIRISL